MKSRDAKERIFALTERQQETADVCTLRFVPEHGVLFDFTAGQYVTLYFPDGRFGWQGKSYSISSAPGQQTFAVSVKKIGQFSSALHGLKRGDKIAIEGPAGYFYPERTVKRSASAKSGVKSGAKSRADDLVFLAAGIGIAPFFSMLNDKAMRDELRSNRRRVFLFYSNRTKGDIVFFQELTALSAKYPNLRVVHSVTRETVDRPEKSDPAIQEYQRFTPAILKKYLQSLSPPALSSSSPPTPDCLRNFHYFICGSISFVNDFWKGLKEEGVAEEQISTEAFY